MSAKPQQKWHENWSILLNIAQFCSINVQIMCKNYVKGFTLS